GEREGRGEGCRELLAPKRLRVGVDAAPERARADEDEIDTAERTEPVLITEQPVAHHGEAEPRDDAEDDIGDCCSEPEDEAEPPAREESAPHTHPPPRPRRHGDHHANEDAFDEIEEGRGQWRWRLRAERSASHALSLGATQPETAG